VGLASLLGKPSLESVKRIVMPAIPDTQTQE
jgi:hypothetical protein